MDDTSGSKVGNLSAAIRSAQSARTRGASVHEFRRRIAEYCRMLGPRRSRASPPACDDPRLSRRLRQTLEALLTGDSEKQVAAKLGLSRHTVHIYVKALYRHFAVSSRGELLAKCLRTA